MTTSRKVKVVKAFCYYHSRRYESGNQTLVIEGDTLPKCIFGKGEVLDLSEGPMDALCGETYLVHSDMRGQSGFMSLHDVEALIAKGILVEG